MKKLSNKDLMLNNGGSLGTVAVAIATVTNVLVVGWISYQAGKEYNTH